MSILKTSEVPLVVHRRVISASMWLRTGLGAGELDVPKRMLLASCEQVLAVRKGVVEAVKKMTDALGDEEKSRQLDVLIQQDRSTQMLMDKTLGASSVVTTENLSLLFDEMIHPHLEQERAKGRAALGDERKKARAAKSELSAQLHAEREKSQEAIDKERAETRRRSDEFAEQVDAERKEAQLAKTEVARIKAEDHELVSSLCSDVEKILAKNRSDRWIFVIFLAIVFAFITLFSESNLATGIGLILNIVLAALTLSGNKLIGVNTDASQAKQKLQSVAVQRGMKSKVDAVVIDWDKKPIWCIRLC